MQRQKSCKAELSETREWAVAREYLGTGEKEGDPWGESRKNEERLGEKNLQAESKV